MRTAFETNEDSWKSFYDEWDYTPQTPDMIDFELYLIELEEMKSFYDLWRGVVLIFVESYSCKRR